MHVNNSNKKNMFDVYRLLGFQLNLERGFNVF